VSLPAQGPGWNQQQPQAKQARPAAKLDRSALWAKCDAMLPRGARDDDLTRPGRVEACVNEGGRH
jgi:hypothetical protein